MAMKIDEQIQTAFSAGTSGPNEQCDYIITLVAIDTSPLYMLRIKRGFSGHSEAAHAILGEVVFSGKKNDAVANIQMCQEMTESLECWIKENHRVGKLSRQLHLTLNFRSFLQGNWLPAAPCPATFSP